MPQVTVKKTAEAASHVIIRVDLLNDDSQPAELNKWVIFTADMCSPPLPINNPRMAMPTFRIMQMWYGMVWFDFTVGFGTLQPEIGWTVSRDCDSHIDFRSFGGVVDPAVYDTPAGAPPDDDNGAIWLSTNGFANQGAQGSIIMDLKKLGITNP